MDYIKSKDIFLIWYMAGFSFFKKDLQRDICIKGKLPLLANDIVNRWNYLKEQFIFDKRMSSTIVQIITSDHRMTAGQIFIGDKARYINIGVPIRSANGEFRNFLMPFELFNDIYYTDDIINIEEQVISAIEDKKWVIAHTSVSPIDIEPRNIAVFYIINLYMLLKCPGCTHRINKKTVDAIKSLNLNVSTIEIFVYTQCCQKMIPKSVKDGIGISGQIDTEIATLTKLSDMVIAKKCQSFPLLIGTFNVYNNQRNLYDTDYIREAYPEAVDYYILQNKIDLLRDFIRNMTISSKEINDVDDLLKESKHKLTILNSLTFDSIVIVQEFVGDTIGDMIECKNIEWANDSSIILKVVFDYVFGIYILHNSLKISHSDISQYNLTINRWSNETVKDDTAKILYSINEDQDTSFLIPAVNCTGHVIDFSSVTPHIDASKDYLDLAKVLRLCNLQGFEYWADRIEQSQNITQIFSDYLYTKVAFKGEYTIVDKYILPVQ